MITLSGRSRSTPEFQPQTFVIKCKTCHFSREKFHGWTFSKGKCTWTKEQVEHPLQNPFSRTVHDWEVAP